MEKRESRRESILNWKDLHATARIGSQFIRLPVLNISIGGLGVLVTEGFSLFQEGEEIFIETLEKQGNVIATSIKGRIAYLGPGVPSRAGIDFSPTDTPIEAYSELQADNNGRIIMNKDEIFHIFKEIKRWSRGCGDMLMIHKQKAIPAEFFYLRPQKNNMVLRIVRISEVRLPFQPQPGAIYPFYLFKGIDVLLFYVEILDMVKNIVEVSWPTEIKYVSRRSVLRYFVTGQEPITAQLIHPINSQEVRLFVWDISVEGMGTEVLDEETPFIQGMCLPSIKLELPSGPVEIKGTIRSVRKDTVLQKTQLGIEFKEGQYDYQDKIISFILERNLPSEMVLKDTDQIL
ncbi:MAG: hypothetical protein J7L53_06045 [Deltaproteobacteria bacterium]|nr:hypothetical protein [Deltaproteobacteria bacterium]